MSLEQLRECIEQGSSLLGSGQRRTPDDTAFGITGKAYGQQMSPVVRHIFRAEMTRPNGVRKFGMQNRAMVVRSDGARLIVSPHAAAEAVVAVIKRFRRAGGSARCRA